MISGTPLFEGIIDLKGELNILRVEPFSSNTEDGFFKFAIENHYDIHSKAGVDVLRSLSALILRRSKDMTMANTNGMPIMGLPPKTVKYVAVRQTESERAFYSWLEYMVSRELADLLPDLTANDERDALAENNTKNKNKERVAMQGRVTMFVNLMRSFTLSPVLITGGFGLECSLHKVNALAASINKTNYKNNALGINNFDGGNIEIDDMDGNGEGGIDLDQMHDGEEADVGMLGLAGGRQARRAINRNAQPKDKTPTPTSMGRQILSIDEAIQLLSHREAEKKSKDKNFVGAAGAGAAAGGSSSNRVRSGDSPEVQLARAEALVEVSEAKRESFEEDEHTHDESRKMATDGYIHY